MKRPGPLPHLIRRFFGSLGARRPSPADQLFVADHLQGAALGLFEEQQVVDQAHALRCAVRVAAMRPDREDLIQAALLHDVGKRHSRLGVMARVVASLLVRMRLPVTTRMQAYLDHGRLGAIELADLGLPEVVAAFAGHDSDRPPPGVHPDDWALLLAADLE